MPSTCRPEFAGLDLNSVCACQQYNEVQLFVSDHGLLQAERVELCL